MLARMTSEPEQQIGVGTPDAFQRLWTPHRMAYIQGENKPTGSGAGDGCPFCSIPTKSDEDGLIVARGERVYAVLNLYPYNGGHLMVVPYRHVADYTDLDEAETAELAELTKRAMRALRAASGAHGFNIDLEVRLQPAGSERASTICRTNFRHMYWSMAQQLAHHTVSGCNVRIGDLMGSGTISGSTEDAFGSLLELTYNGKKPLALDGGIERSFIEDGDVVTMTAHCEGSGYVIGFGEVSGKVLPALFNEQQ